METKPRLVEIPPLGLQAELAVPADARAIVLFAHGSGSSRLSPRNTRVAAALRRAGLGTLLFDLLTPSEGEDRRLVFDVELLADRLIEATAWVRAQEAAGGLAVGYFGASTGAAATLIAAARGDNPVGAIVSRGGRPDLAGRFLARVRAPTLLVVGSLDRQVLELNRQALAALRCEKRLATVPGATHLFEEPGTLEAVIDLACDWFTGHCSITIPSP
jgi:predicted alpha/beta-hydrolase family hydrolase